MNQPQAGIPAVTEQAAQASTPLQPGQPQATPQPNPAASPAATPPTDPTNPAQPGATPAQAQPSPEFLALQKQNQELQNQARYHQSRADTEAARVRALVGAQPTVDPLAQYSAKYKADGFDDDAAKAMAQIELRSDQRFAQLQQSMQANHQVPTVMSQLTSQYSQLVRFPAALQAASAALSDVAMNGGFAANGITNPLEYAKAIASQVAAQELLFGGQQQQPAPQQYQQPNINSQFAPSFNGYAPPQFAPAGQPPVPEHIRLAQEQHKADIAKRYPAQ